MSQAEPEHAGAVTIIVPTYNGARFLPATLDSLAAQDYVDIEVIVVDDGSSDESANLARRHPAVHRVVEQRNLGAAVARNRGLALARGRWVAFLDQDDLWHASRVSALVRLAVEQSSLASATSEQTFALESDRAELVHLADGRASWVDRWLEDGAASSLWTEELDPAELDIPVEHVTVERFMEGAAAVTTSFLFDRETAIAAGGCAVHARALDDHVLAANVARINGGSIPRTPARLLYYRIHPTSATTTSPLVGPVLSMTAAMRLGGVFPREQRLGHNLEHLLYGLAASDLTRSEQLALLVLTVPPRERFTWFRRWLARATGIRK
ncbi:hypothetical protein GCM10023221_12670 [Luteimicrobium xylanilyticum]|uniref:Putative glycosyltransferase n=1 Tax=Luteimicrobium xylanilyticum TaxID=1133546 RepID=A0A5P9QDX9_9MICO|nr:glycosyltransferase family A protein [Luteimicrobium xylanilyticum]QFU99260.1 putative glycosyltransferase [Luteimicrobium xylanilyticum]